MPEGQEQTGGSNRVVLTVVVLVGVLVVGWWLFSRGGSREPIDLIAAFESAEKRPAPSALTVEDVALNGESLRSVVTNAPATRLIYRIRVPQDGWFSVSLGLKPEAWEKEGDGVLFMVGVSDGRTYDELFTEHVNPYGDPTNRRWIPVKVDISAYGGEEVELILNTRSGPAGREGDERNDLAVWGAPHILVR